MAVMKSLTLNGTTYDIAAGGSATTAKTVTLYGDKWTSEDEYQHYQVVPLEGVTTKTRVEIQPTPELLQVLYIVSLGLYVENIEGVVRVYAIGANPEGADLTVQLTMTEVEVG